jgi:dynein heavy chain
MLHNILFICFAVDVWSYVQQIRTLVEDLQGRVLKAQLNVHTIRNLINTWSRTPLFERKDRKKEKLLLLDDHDERVFKRWVIYTKEIVLVSC